MLKQVQISRREIGGRVTLALVTHYGKVTCRFDPAAQPYGASDNGYVQVNLALDHEAPEGALGKSFFSITAEGGGYLDVRINGVQDDLAFSIYPVQREAFAEVIEAFVAIMSGDDETTRFVSVDIPPLCPIDVAEQIAKALDEEDDQ